MPPESLIGPSPATRALSKFLEIRLAIVRVALSDAPETLEFAREALRVIGRKANHAVRDADFRRAEDVTSHVFFAARSHIADARQLLAPARATHAELVRARHRLYRGISLVVELLAAGPPEGSRALMSEAPLSQRGDGVLFAEFVTQVVAATRANAKDIGWLLEVADTEIGIAAAHPRFAKLSSEHRDALSGLRAELAEWSTGARNPETGFGLLNRLMLQADCMNH